MATWVLSPKKTDRLKLPWEFFCYPFTGIKFKKETSQLFMLFPNWFQEGKESCNKLADISVNLLHFSTFAAYHSAHSKALIKIND